MSPRRKCIAEHLAKNGGEAEIEDIISSILDLENKERNHKSRKSVYVSLMQTHLPKLEKEGIVRYDKRLGKLYLVNVPEGFELYTETVGKYDIPWSILFFPVNSDRCNQSLFFKYFFSHSFCGVCCECSYKYIEPENKN
ncbi:MAG: hypothetical protein HA490_03875 [Archaeoglobales archaeon]|nr:hypothetical protein [Archaeoglobales archaeon]